MNRCRLRDVAACVLPRSCEQRWGTDNVILFPVSRERLLDTSRIGCVTRSTCSGGCESASNSVVTVFSGQLFHAEGMECSAYWGSEPHAATDVDLVQPSLAKPARSRHCQRQGASKGLAVRLELCACVRAKHDDKKG